MSSPASESHSLSELLDSRIGAELRRIELRTRRSLSSELIGSYRSAFRGTGLVLADLREYQPGDNVKDIHWQASARSNRTYVKAYEEDRSLNILLVVDISNSTNYGGGKTKHLRSLEFAAILTLLAKQSSDAVGLCLFADQVREFIPSGRSHHQARRVLLELLRRRHLAGGTDLAGALDYVHRRQQRRAVIFVISDFYCAPFQETLRRLAFRHDVICTLVEQAADQELPPVGLVEFIDAESGARCTLDTSARRTRQRLREHYQQRREELQQICRRVGADYLQIADQPLKALADMMRARTRRLR